MKAFIAVVVVVVVLAGGYLIYRSYSNKYSTTNTTTTQPTPTNTPTANTVSIVNMSFSPSSLTVTAGTTVTWVNNDSVTHTVTETDNQTGPKSGNLAPGQSYTFTFSSAGTYQYHCSIHTSMTGSVTVTAS